MSRAKWKGIYVKTNSKNLPNLMSRNSSITPNFIERKYKIHNGKNFKSIIVLKEMVGYKFGEFFKTRTDFAFKKKRKK